MSRLRWLSAALIIPFCLSSCATPNLLGQTPAAQVLAAALAQYDFEVVAGFAITSVDESDKELIEQVRSSFEADLRAGRTEAYKRDKDFSIHLLSGSEGNYFSSPEFLQSSLTQVLATLVVIDGEHTGIFKGQFDSPRFVFADPGEEFELADRTKAYLLTADGSFAVQTYKGELVPDSELADDSHDADDASSGQAPETSAPAEDEPLPARRQRTQPARPMPRAAYQPQNIHMEPYGPAWAVDPEGNPIKVPIPIGGAVRPVMAYANDYGTAYTQPYDAPYDVPYDVPYGPGEAYGGYSRPAVPGHPVIAGWGGETQVFEAGGAYAGEPPYPPRFPGPAKLLPGLQDPARDPFQAGDELKAGIAKRQQASKLIRAEKRMRASYPVPAYPASAAHSAVYAE